MFLNILQAFMKKCLHGIGSLIANLRLLPSSYSMDTKIMLVGVAIFISQCRVTLKYSSVGSPHLIKTRINLSITLHGNVWMRNMVENNMGNVYWSSWIVAIYGMSTLMASYNFLWFDGIICCHWRWSWSDGVVLLAGSVPVVQWGPFPGRFTLTILK